MVRHGNTYKESQNEHVVRVKDAARALRAAQEDLLAAAGWVKVPRDEGWGWRHPKHHLAAFDAAVRRALEDLS